MSERPTLTVNESRPRESGGGGHAVRFSRTVWWPTVVAWGLSGLLHGGLFLAFYAVSWAPGHETKPELLFRRGRYAVEVSILTQPWSTREESRDERESEDIPEPSTSRPSVPTGGPPPDPEPVVRDVSPSPPPEPSPAQPERAAEAEASDSIPSLARPDRRPLPERTVWNPFPDVGSVVRETAPQRSPPVKEVEEPAEVEEAEVKKETEPREEKPEIAPPVSSASPAKDPGKPSPSSPLKVQPKPVAPPHPPTERPIIVRSKAETSRPRPSPQPAPASVDREPGTRTGAKVLSLPRPRYPYLSRRLGEEGLVLLEVEVLPSGRAGRITVVEEPGHPRLVEAARKAARKARFKPATRNGRPVRSSVQIPFRFILE